MRVYPKTILPFICANIYVPVFLTFFFLAAVTIHRPFSLIQTQCSLPTSIHLEPIESRPYWTASSSFNIVTPILRHAWLVLCSIFISFLFATTNSEFSTDALPLGCYVFGFYPGPLRRNKRVVLEETFPLGRCVFVLSPQSRLPRQTRCFWLAHFRFVPIHSQACSIPVIINCCLLPRPVCPTFFLAWVLCFSFLQVSTSTFFADFFRYCDSRLSDSCSASFSSYLTPHCHRHPNRWQPTKELAMFWPYILHADRRHERPRTALGCFACDHSLPRSRSSAIFCSLWVEYPISLSFTSFSPFTMNVPRIMWWFVPDYILPCQRKPSKSFKVYTKRYCNNLTCLFHNLRDEFSNDTLMHNIDRLSCCFNILQTEKNYHCEGNKNVVCFKSSCHRRIAECNLLHAFGAVPVFIDCLKSLLYLIGRKKLNCQFACIAERVRTDIVNVASKSWSKPTKCLSTPHIFSEHITTTRPFQRLHFFARRGHKFRNKFSTSPSSIFFLSYAQFISISISGENLGTLNLGKGGQGPSSIRRLRRKSRARCQA